MSTNDKSEPLHGNLRDLIGQAISDEIAAGAAQPDWCDSREIDRLADAVMAVLPKRRTPLSPELRAALDEAAKTGALAAELPGGGVVFINRGEQPGNYDIGPDCPACGGSGLASDAAPAPRIALNIVIDDTLPADTAVLSAGGKSVTLEGFGGADDAPSGGDSRAIGSAAPYQHDAQERSFIGKRLRRLSVLADYEPFEEDEFYYRSAFSILGEILREFERRAAAPAVQVPEGWALAPVAVTDEMLEAWKGELSVPIGSSPEAKARRAYRAMLAASPAAPSPAQAQPVADGAPDMLWDDSDPEIFANSADEFANDYAHGSMSPGDVSDVKVQCAARLPSRTLRIEYVDDENRTVKWEWLALATKPAEAS